jgi:hypothetical protein
MPWFKARNVAVLGRDLAMDAMPSNIPGVSSPVHILTLVAMGAPILDNLDLEAVAKAAAARKRWTFLLTVAPLPVEGGTGSPFNPIATFWYGYDRVDSLLKLRSFYFLDGCGKLLSSLAQGADDVSVTATGYWCTAQWFWRAIGSVKL